MRQDPNRAEAVDAVVWTADDRVFNGLDYGTRLAERLAARGLRVRREDLTAANGRLPAARLHVLSGGGTSVGDRSGWMPEGLRLTRSLVDGARQHEHSLLGVCLGSQMIAEVLWPGSVSAGERIAVGLIEVAWRASDDVEEEAFAVPAFHYEEINRSRAVDGGAQVVADNVHGGLEGFRMGDRLWGVQFHPELEPGDVRRLVMHHRRTIETYRSSVAAALDSIDRLEPSWSPLTFERILDHVTGTHAR